MPSPRIIISGGGTGGHVFPAIAIANTLRKNNPECEILFVGAKGKLEMEKVPAAGYKIEGLWISGLQRKLTFKNLSFPFKLISSIWKCKNILKKFKPDVVVGVGGYASGPMLRVAVKSRVPTLIQEQNSFPGITNRLLAKSVSKICVAYDNMNRFFPESKIIKTGNPVRMDMVELRGKKEAAAETFGLKKNKLTVLVIGGSLGARTINQSLLKALPQIRDNMEVQVLWQCGKFYADQVQKEVGDIYPNVKVLPFISEMDKAYALADIIISRAGAMSISELCLVNKPCILVPSPNVAEDHQTKNALALVNKEAALLVKDSEAMEKLWSVTEHLIANAEERNLLSQQISTLGLPEAADNIAKEILKLIEK